MPDYTTYASKLIMIRSKFHIKSTLFYAARLNYLTKCQNYKYTYMHILLNFVDFKLIKRKLLYHALLNII